MGSLVLRHHSRKQAPWRFRGREMAHQRFGLQVLERVREDLLELANVELMPKMEGRQMVMVLAPRKKK